MTNEEAIKRIIQHMNIHKMNEPRAIMISMALQMAIYSLEKQIAKKPLMRYENMGLGISPNESFKVFGCPCCKEEIDEERTNFCPNCGQKIDWEEGENNVQDLK